MKKKNDSMIQWLNSSFVSLSHCVIVSFFVCFIVSLFHCFILVSSVFAAEPAKNIPLGNIEGFGGFVPKLFDSADFTKPEGIGGVFERVFSTLLAIFTIIGGMMFLIYFALGSLSWITAGGDQEKIKKAQAQMTNGLLGLVVLVGAYSFFYIIGLVLGFDFLNPAQTIYKYMLPKG